MKTLKNLERLQQLHNIIEEEHTGTPTELAGKMQISERKVYNLLEQLKDFEAKICYSRTNKTYYYCDDFKLQVSISVTVMSNNELTEIYAGSYFLKEKYFPASFVQGTQVHLQYQNKPMRIEKMFCKNYCLTN